MQRGFLMESTNERRSLKPWSVPALAAAASSPMISCWYLSTQVSTFASDLLATEILKPFSATFKARFCPMTPKPYSPISAIFIFYFVGVPRGI
jgi:hypothetical protein